MLWRSMKLIFYWLTGMSHLTNEIFTGTPVWSNHAFVLSAAAWHLFLLLISKCSAYVLESIRNPNPFLPQFFINLQWEKSSLSSRLADLMWVFLSCFIASKKQRSLCVYVCSCLRPRKLPAEEIQHSVWNHWTFPWLILFIRSYCVPTWEPVRSIYRSLNVTPSGSGSPFLTHIGQHCSE